MKCKMVASGLTKESDLEVGGFVLCYLPLEPLETRYVGRLEDVYWSLFEMYFGRIEKTDWTGLRPLMLWSRVGDGFERFCTVFEIWSVFAKFS